MTDQLVVVADNRSLSLGLTGLDYDVLDLRPDEFSQWLDSSSPPVALVVGVEQPADALDIVAVATTRHAQLPVLLVASSAGGWSSVAQADDPRISVLPLPLTRLSLVSAVQRLTSATLVPAHVVAPAASELTPIVEPVVVADPAPEPDDIAPSPAAEPAPQQPSATEVPARHMVAARSTDALRARLAERAATAAPPAAPAMDDVPRPQSAGLVVDAEPSVVDDRTARRHASPSDIPTLVHALLDRVDQLYDVRDAALAVVEESVGVAHATAGVLLLPDEGSWRVCGAIGVRPLEWRYIVEPDSWLVTTVVHGSRGVIVEDSDIARQRLGGAPLTHHPQLLAAPVPAADGLLLVARDDAPFSEDELSAVAKIASQAGRLLADAVLVRSLARALGDFRAADD
jgi:hypothetical protein